MIEPVASTGTEPGTDDPAGLDPRIERSRRVIQDAAIVEMAAVGYGAMTVEAVAKRAGVSKATIYRQWKSKLEIVESALAAMSDDIVVDEWRPPKQRLTHVLTSLAAHLADAENPSSACIPALVSAARYDDEVRAFHLRFGRERRAVMTAIVREGQEVGEIDASLDPDRVIDILVGPLFYRRLMTADPFPPDEVAALVATILG